MSKPRPIALPSHSCPFPPDSPAACASRSCPSSNASSPITYRTMSHAQCCRVIEIVKSPIQTSHPRRPLHPTPPHPHAPSIHLAINTSQRVHNHRLSSPALTTGGSGYRTANPSYCLPPTPTPSSRSLVSSPTEGSNTPRPPPPPLPPIVGTALALSALRRRLG